MSSKSPVSPDNSETNNSQVVVPPTSEVLSPTTVAVSYLTVIYKALKFYHKFRYFDFHTLIKLFSFFIKGMVVQLTIKSFFLVSTPVLCL